jgi:rRNA processing protein Gar1
MSNTPICIAPHTSFWLLSHVAGPINSPHFTITVSTKKSSENTERGLADLVQTDKKCKKVQCQ